MRENGRVPELPEVHALVEFLRERTDGLAIVGIELGSISVLKTYDPAPASLHGLPIGGVTRHGKFIDIEAEGLHLVFHLARAGWLRWADSLDEEQIERLYAALRGTLAGAISAASGKPAKALKDAKRAGMRVHGRTGQACPVCGDVVREVSFAESSLQYCATCQTGGKPLADRRMSRLLK